MAGKRPPEPEPEPEDIDPCDAMSITELAAFVQANPFAHLKHGDIRRLFNIGQKLMTAIVAKHPPSIARKINPHHFRQWLWENREMVETLSA